MRCPNCSTDLPDTAKFCLECGRDLRPRADFASPAAYTPRHLAERILTTRAALAGEHKQVTVLFCDIANSTPLAERVGPERMHALLNGFFELALAEVYRYEGTINQFLGDGYHWTRTPRADKAVEALGRVAARAMAAHANAEAVAVLREAESHAARLDAGRHRATLRLLLARSQAQILLGQVPESLDELRTRADLVERVADPSLTAEYHFRLASALGMLGDSPAAIQEAGRALDEAKRAGDLAIEGKAQYILTRESFWSGDLHAGIAHGRQAVALLERAGERWWLAMAHWARALSYTLLGGFDDALDSIARVQTIADRLRGPRLASQAAWTRGWIHAMRGDWATGIEAGRLGLELAPDDMARALAQGFLGSSYVERDDTATALALLEPATEAFRRLRFRQLEGWFTILQAHARVTAGDPGGAAVLPARGEDIVRGVTFAPAVVEARLVEGLIARARGEDGQAEHAFSEALTRSERLGARFFAARMRLALAGLAGARGDHGMKARYLGDDRAEFQALGAPVWAERAAGEASRRVGAAD